MPLESSNYWPDILGEEPFSRALVGNEYQIPHSEFKLGLLISFSLLWTIMSTLYFQTRVTQTYQKLQNRTLGLYRTLLMVKCSNLTWYRFHTWSEGLWGDFELYRLDGYTQLLEICMRRILHANRPPCHFLWILDCTHVRVTRWPLHSSEGYSMLLKFKVTQCIILLE